MAYCAVMPENETRRTDTVSERVIPEQPASRRTGSVRTAWGRCSPSVPLKSHKWQSRTWELGAKHGQHSSHNVATKFECRALSKVEMSHHGSAGRDESTRSGVSWSGLRSPIGGDPVDLRRL